MCGISGIISFAKPVSDSELITVNAMSETIKHRGPDGKSTYLSKCRSAVFSHRLLSIVDVGNSNQPMVFEINATDEVILNFNGEIYNFREIRKSLKAKGHTFSTNGDTEVVLKSYIEWGHKCLDEFDGDFAIAIFDSRTDSLFIARDRLGVKPLFFSNHDNKFFFCSEPKGFAPVFNDRLRPDSETIADFFLEKDILTNACARPDRSFYEGVRSLEAGCFAVITSGSNGPKIRERKYWDVPFNDIEHFDINESKLNINRGLINSVLERSPTEVSFGTLLSGGLDSGLVTSILLKNSACPYIASINFSGSNELDWRYASLFANAYTVEVQAPELTVTKLTASIDSLVDAMDEPHDTSRQLGLLSAYGVLSESNCKVAIVGEGADEFNLGYYHMYPGFKVDSSISTRQGFIEACLQRSDFAYQWLRPEFVASHPAEKYINESIEKYFLSDNYNYSIQHYYIKRFLKYRLDANDRCGMHHGIEARVPFCDHQLVEEFLRVPFKENIDPVLEKLVLRDAFKGYLHDTIRMRNKYALPENNSLTFHRKISELLRERMPNSNSALWVILDPNKVKNSIRDYEALIKRSDQGNPPRGALKALAEPIALTNPSPSLKAKHFFTLLTFFIWFSKTCET